MAKKFDIDLWQYKSLGDTRKMSVQQIMDDYARTIKYAKGRLKRLRAAGLGETLVAERLKNAIIPVSELASKDAKAAAMLELAKATRAKMATPAGYRKGAEEFILQMHERGETWLSIDKYDDFRRFMEEAARKAAGQRYYDSLNALRAYEQLERLRVKDKSFVFDDFDYWYSHVDDLENVPEPKGRQRWTGKKLKNYLGW